MNSLIEEIKKSRKEREVFSISVDKVVLANFRKICKKGEVKISQVIEFLMKDFVKVKEKDS